MCVPVFVVIGIMTFSLMILTRQISRTFFYTVVVKLEIVLIYIFQSFERNHCFFKATKEKNSIVHDNIILRKMIKKKNEQRHTLKASSTQID